MDVFSIPGKPLSLNGAYTPAPVNGSDPDDSSSDLSDQARQKLQDILPEDHEDYPSSSSEQAYSLFQTDEMRNFKRAVELTVQDQADETLPTDRPIILAVKFVFDTKVASGPIGDRNEAILDEDSDVTGRVIPHPDTDGPIKATVDAIEGVIVEDDKQIVDYHLYSQYDPENPRIVIGVDYFKNHTIPEDLRGV